MAPPSWRDSSDQERQAGADLLRLFLQLYASCRITAQQLCVACDLCTKAKVPGGSFQLYAKEKGDQSAKYQRHLDQVPMNVNHSATRTIRNVPVRLGYEVLRDELHEDPVTLQTLQAPPNG
eukprot:2716124-Pyramimonas_sp.AAC.1